MAFPTAILANALAPFLTGRFTLEQPVTGGGWTTVATGVPGQQQGLPSGLAAAMSPFSGGVKAYGRWRIWLPGTTTAAAQWRVTNETTGAVFTVEDDNLASTDQPFLILDVREA
jgi:hypothetical protein